MELLERLTWAILGVMAYHAGKNLIQEAIRLIKILRGK